MIGWWFGLEDMIFFVCDVISYSISVCIIVVFFKEGFVGFVGFFLMFIILEKNI